MEGAFTHLGNHLISDSASTINAGDDLSTIDPDESLLDGEYGRGNLTGGPQRRRHDDDDEGTEIFDDDTESLASLPVDGVKARQGLKSEEEKELPAHACA
jgi:regulator of nonsense transcripts 1